jgi:hypothetical protein
MRKETRFGRRNRLACERLEPRWAPRASSISSGLTVDLDPALDQSGQHVITSQAYVDAERSTYAIFDTGSPVISFSARDQAAFSYEGDPIPVKVPGGASATLVSGRIVGDVSQPGEIDVAGVVLGIPPSPGSAGSKPALPLKQVGRGFGGDGSGPDSPSGNIQAFIGTPAGSPNLPALAGTPILAPNLGDPQGLAAFVSMGGLSLVNPGAALPGVSGASGITRVPLTLSGSSNVGTDGKSVTMAPVPVQNDVRLVDSGVSVAQQRFLFDTGSQITIISPAAAAALGLNIAALNARVEVKGDGGAESVPALILPELDIPDVNGGTVRFTNVPVAVLNLGGGFDGVLGMNLLNQASEFIYDPYGPGGATLSIAFMSSRPPASLGSASYPGNAINPALAGSLQETLPGLQINNGRISGHVFLDFNANGAMDAGEPRLSGVKLFLDLQGDGRLDAGDPVTVTDSAGAYTFANLASGTYTVGQQTPDSLIAVNHSTAITVSLAVNSAAATANFGDQPRAQTANQGFIIELYGTLLDRGPDRAGLSTWLAGLNAGAPAPSIVAAVWASAEHRVSQVQSYYEAFLHRPADPAGLKFWLSQFLAGAGETAVEAGILLSPEYQQRHASDTAFISGLYLDVLGRGADTAAMAAWQNVLGLGETRVRVILQVLTSAEEYRRLVDGYYTTLLHRNPDVAGEASWVGLLQSGKLEPADAANAFLDSSEFSSWTRHIQGLA